MKPVDKLVINYLRNKFKIPHDVVIDVKSDPSSSIKTMNFKFDLADETSLKLIIVKFNDYLRSK